MNATHILVPLDGSAVSEVALPYAVAIARALDSHLLLLGVVEDEAEQTLAASTTAARERLLQWQRAELESYLADEAGHLRERGIAVSTGLHWGKPAAEIVAAGAAPDVAAIVMATHGRGGLSRLFIGSVADAVMRSTTRSILLVRPDAQPEPRRGLQIRRILVPLDGSALAEAALPHAAAIAQGAGASVALVCARPPTVAWSPDGGYVPNMSEVEEELAQSDADSLARARRLLPAELAVEQAVLRGTVATSLVEYAQENDVDLTVMTTHGRGGLHRLVLGSVADRLVRLGLPVFLVHSAPLAEGMEANGPAAAGGAEV